MSRASEALASRKRKADELVGKLVILRYSPVHKELNTPVRVLSAYGGMVYLEGLSGMFDARLFDVVDGKGASE